MGTHHTTTSTILTTLHTPMHIHTHTCTLHTPALTHYTHQPSHTTHTLRTHYKYPHTHYTHQPSHTTHTLLTPAQTHTLHTHYKYPHTLHTPHSLTHPPTHIHTLLCTSEESYSWALMIEPSVLAMRYGLLLVIVGYPDISLSWYGKYCSGSKKKLSYTHCKYRTVSPHIVTYSSTYSHIETHSSTHIRGSFLSKEKCNFHMHTNSCFHQNCFLVYLNT